MKETAYFILAAIMVISLIAVYYYYSSNSATSTVPVVAIPASTPASTSNPAVTSNPATNIDTTPPAASPSNDTSTEPLPVQTTPPPVVPAATPALAPTTVGGARLLNIPYTTMYMPKTVPHAPVAGITSATLIPKASGGKCTYTFLPFLDGGTNNDMGNKPVGTSIADLQTACDANTGCVAFNSNGWMKSSVPLLSTMGSWTTNPLLGVYVKNQLSCGQPQTVNGFYAKSAGDNQSLTAAQISSTDAVAAGLGLPVAYNFAPHEDGGNGNDISGLGPTTPITSMASTCSKNTSCIGFNTNGWLKNKMLPYNPPSTGPTTILTPASTSAVSMGTF